MALKATIFKATLDVADMDRGYYATHALTLARHPSETDLRMMERILALALRTMQLQCTIEDGHVWCSDHATTVTVEMANLLTPQGDAR
ncbi:MAG: YaeQ family protein [Burkholderiales bacterium]|nr:YaeQ family protein [Burkholderiales bacterium]